MDRICPRDFTLLEARDWGAATYLYCPKCRGVLLERLDMEKIVQSGAAPRIERQEAPTEDLDLQDGSALCSCAGVAMKTFKRDGVTLDLCPECNAVWFDAGELERVVVENRRRFTTTLSGGRPGGGIGAATPLDGVKMILKGVGDFLLDLW